MADEHYTDDDAQTTPNTGEKLGAKGLGNQVKGKAKEVGGKIQSGVGDLTNNESMEAKGKAKELEGKAQQAGGKAEEKLGDALNPNNP